MRCFVDTNVFVYVYCGRKAGARRQQAADLLTHVMADADTEVLINYQVVQEFCNVALKKGSPAAAVDDIVRTALMPLSRDVISETFHGRVLKLYGQASISFYDACIVQAAIDLDCTVLYTEDLQDGRRFGELMVVNPFK